jgi:hypothetical protein
MLGEDQAEADVKASTRSCRNSGQQNNGKSDARSLNLKHHRKMKFKCTFHNPIVCFACCGHPAAAMSIAMVESIYRSNIIALTIHDISTTTAGMMNSLAVAF